MNKREIISEIKAKLTENKAKLERYEISPVEWSNNTRYIFDSMLNKSGYAIGTFSQLWNAANRELAIESGVYCTTQFMMP